MLVAGPDTVFAVHLLEGSWAIDGHDHASVSSAKIWGRQLVDLGCLHYTVNPAALLLADAQPAHQVGEAFVARLVAVDEPLDRHYRFARIRDLHAVAIHLYHHRRAAHAQVLVDQCVGDQLSDHYFGHQLHFLAQRAFDHLVLRPLA